MHTTPSQALPAQGILTLRKPSALQLRVLSGCVWLTESDDPTDHFLQAGDSVNLHSDRVVIEAQQDSLIALTPAAKAPLTKASWRHPPALGPTQLPGTAAPWWQRGPAPFAGLFQRPFRG